MLTSAKHNDGGGHSKHVIDPGSIPVLIIVVQAVNDLRVGDDIDGEGSDVQNLPRKEMKESALSPIRMSIKRLSTYVCITRNESGGVWFVDR